MIYKLALFVHLTGLILLAGSILFSFIGFQKNLKMNLSNSNASSTFVGIANLGFGLGMGLLVLSGVTFIVISNAYTFQIWFRLKMGMLLLIIINHTVLGRSAMKKLLNDTNDQRFDLQKLNVYYFAQLLILVTVIVLSTFKFS